MNKSVLILCIALLATVLSSSVIAGEAPVDTSPARNVSVVHIGYPAEYAHCTMLPAACTDEECNDEAEDWCTDNDHDDGDTEPTQDFSFSGGNGNCHITCADGYMAILVEECESPANTCPDGQHLRKVVVTAPPPDNRIWIQFNAPGQDERRLVIYDPRDDKPANVQTDTD